MINRVSIIDLYAQNLQQKLALTQRSALINTREAQAKAKKKFDGNVRVTSFKVGVKVLMETILARAGKLTPIFKGPFEIIELMHSNVYKRRDLDLYHKRVTKTPASRYSSATRTGSKNTKRQPIKTALIAATTRPRPVRPAPLKLSPFDTYSGWC